MRERSLIWQSDGPGGTAQAQVQILPFPFRPECTAGKLQTALDKRRKR